MDIFQAARYFDLLRFENYDFSSGAWADTYFEGQLKKSDVFQTIYHRPTRKRMLFCAPYQEPASSVVRVCTTGETFMVGALQEDSHQNTHYRNVYALHKPEGPATITRLSPVGPSSNPGWAQRVFVEETFGDVELRSVNENEDNTLNHYGHFFVTLPSNCQVREQDTVVVGGKDYYVLETYTDSSLCLARAVQHVDPRQNFTYWKYGPDTYSGGHVIPGGTNYNVTGRVGPVDAREIPGDIVATAIQVIIPVSWIGFEPGSDDKITIGTRQYSVYRIYHDFLKDEWVLTLKY